MEKEMESPKPGTWPLAVYENRKELVYVAYKHKMEAKFFRKKGMCMQY